MLVFKDQGKIELWQSSTELKWYAQFHWNFTNHVRIIIHILYNSPSLQVLLLKLISHAISGVWIGHTVKQCICQPGATNIALVFYKCWQNDTNTLTSSLTRDNKQSGEIWRWIVVRRSDDNNDIICTEIREYHDDILPWKRFPYYRSFVMGIHRRIPLTTGQWCSDEGFRCT